MPAVTVRLIDDEAANSVSLTGTQAAAGASVDIQQLVVRREGAVEATLNIAAPIALPIEILKPDGADRFHLQRPAVGVSVDLAFLAITNPLFGITFDANAGVRVVLRLRLDPTASADVPAIELLVSGAVKIGTLAGADAFSPVPLGYRILLDEPPAFPCPAPDLSLELPGELPWPTLRLPWSYPLKFPSVEDAITLPAYRVPLIGDRLTIGWDAVVVSADLPALGLVVLVKRLRATGLIDLFVSLKITFGASGFDIVPVEDSGQILIGNVKLKRFAPGCFGIDAKAANLTPLLSLTASEVADDQANSDYKLRVHAPDGAIEEIRLDWAVAATLKTIHAPGFTITLDAIQMLSLVLQRSESDDSWALALIATFNSETPISIETAFGWTSGAQEQERFRDTDTNHTPSLLQLKFKVSQAMSLALAKLSFGGVGPIFFQKLLSPLPPLTEAEEDAGDGDGLDFDSAGLDPCPRAMLESTSLSTDDVKDLDLLVNGDSIKLPFMDGPMPGLTGDQLLQVLGLEPPPAAPPPPGAPPAAPSPLVIRRNLKLRVTIASLSFDTFVVLRFDLERLAFEVQAPDGIDLVLKDDFQGDFLGLTWKFVVRAADRKAFRLVIDQRSYAIKQLATTDITISYDKATMPGDAIEFSIRDFSLGARGLTLTAAITDKPARLNGLETQFRFTQGVLTIIENRIADFTIGGSGPMPPALIDNAVVDIGLQFSQEPGGNIQLRRGHAEVRGPKLLECKSTRFEFELDSVGLEFVHENGADHLYFTLSGKARYKLAAGDDSSGPLAWLPGIEIQLVNCPLTGNMRTIAKHVNFLIELPKKVRFSLLGCFTMEIRALGFLPQFDKLSDTPAAMRVSGQILFADTGDLVDAKVDLHDLYIALPESGKLFPRLYLKQIGVRIAQGEAFALEGSVEFFNGEEIEPGIKAQGFAGEGSVTIKGLPTIAATLAWLRVSNDGGLTWKRAWFIYLEARRMSLRIPVVEIYIREIGIGFGYRYTLAAFKAIDGMSDPKQLLKKLKEISKTQGNLSKRDQWRVDLEGPGEDARWTVVLRALFASTSAQVSPFTGYDPTSESELASLYIFDAVLAVRSDLTFFLAGRAWLNTNYNDYLTQEKIRNAPLLTGFMMLSVKQKRFLANLSSNADAEFGDHPPLPGFLKDLIRGSRFSATLLIEPGLLHYELGWPNQLQLNVKLGPLQVQIRAGTIFRLSTRELVVGNSLLARGKLEIKAEFDAGFFGAGLYALADVSYGARYIGVLSFDDPTGNSALYGAIGLDIKVQIEIRFWLRIKIGFIKISIDLSISFQIQFTAALQAGILLDKLPGVLGTAAISVRIMGRGCGFSVRVGINDASVELARQRTEKYLHIGLEAEDVEAIPGTTAQPLPGPPPPAAPPLEPVALLLAEAPVAAPKLPAAPPVPGVFETPNYYLGQGVPQHEANVRYFVLIPREAERDAGADRFFPVPPDNGLATTADFSIQFSRGLPAGVTLERFDLTQFTPVASNPQEWKVDWDRAIQTERPDGSHGADTLLRHWMRLAYLVNPPISNDPSKAIDDLSVLTPTSDPAVNLTAGKNVVDQRVQNPTDSAFEAAVRGAAEQFASPYFKFDPNSEYDASMLEAFRPGTSVYSHNGEAPQDVPVTKSQEPTSDQCAIETRGSIIQAITRDFFRYVDLPVGDSARADLETKSLAFRFGLVFKIIGPPDAVTTWLEDDLANGAAKIRQRVKTNETAPPLAPEARVDVFNPVSHWFSIRPPEFAKVRTYTHANTVAIDWKLGYPPDLKLLAENPDNRDEIEHHLRYYRVRREHLDGNDPTVEFTIKPADVLHRQNDGGVLRLPPRFQLADHFADQNSADIEALTANGKTYLYTITPVDLAGHSSRRPLSVVATRYPSDPPAVPSDGEFVVQYGITSDLSDVPEPTAVPTLRKPRALRFRFSDPVEPAGRPVIPVRNYYLIFRREPVVPVGFYGADERIRGVEHRGLAVSNARRLRTDFVFKLDTPVEFEDGERGDSGRAIRTVTIRPEDLPTDLFAGGEWKPEGWSLYLQVEGPGNEQNAGVLSALAAVAVRMEFVKLKPADLADVDFEPGREERRFNRLEWLPDPVRLNLLPPTDVRAEPGFAKVPMPSLADPNLWEFPTVFDPTHATGLRYEPHPARLRAVKLIWNQGPSDDPAHPLALHARYQVYEYAAFDHPGDILDSKETTIHFPTWAASAGLTQVQEVDLVPAEDLGSVPTEIGNPQAWEAWYPSNSRRLLVKAEQVEKGVWPPSSEAAYGSWFSFRESNLTWPDVRDLFDSNGIRIRGFHPYLEDVAAWIARMRVGEVLPSYFAEVGPQAPRIDDRSNTDDVNPIKTQTPSSALEKFLAATGAETDPYGWGILQRMGLAMGLRVRNRLTNDSVTGPKLMEMIAQSIAIQSSHKRFVFNVKDPNENCALTLNTAAPDTSYRWSIAGIGPVFELAKGADLALPTLKLPPLKSPKTVILDVWGTLPVLSRLINLENPNQTAVVYKPEKHLHVEQLFQPGRRMIVMPGEASDGGSVPADSALAMVQLSLRPAVAQKFHYERIELTGAQPADLRAKDTIEVEFILGANAPAWYLRNSGTSESAVELTAASTKVNFIAGTDGTIVILLRAVNPGGIGIAAKNTTPRVAPVITRSPFDPTDGASTGFDAVAVDPADAEWSKLRQLIRVGDTQIREVDFNEENYKILQSWLGRFFAHGGDIDLATGATPAKIWIASAYPRASSPLPLSPDSAGRITSYRPIESLWGQAFRYYVRPRGRYELLWEELGRSRRLVDTLGEIETRQSTLAAPEPGGADVALSRIRPVAAPLVLSSRRLDPPATPGAAAVPGAIWEVLVAGHSEQTLINRNRSLQNHLEFRQLSVSLIRGFAPEPEKRAAQVAAFGRCVSDAFPPELPFERSFPQLLLTAADGSVTPIDRHANPTLANTVSVINGFTGTTKITASIDTLPDTRVRIILMSQPPSPIVALRTAAGAPSLLTTAQNLGDEALLWPTWENSPHLAKPALPQLPTLPDHVDLTTLEESSAVALDWPLRDRRFNRAATALQYDGLPYYYSQTMLLVAQTSAVVSAVTSIEQRDYEYICPELTAIQEGIVGSEFTVIQEGIAVTATSRYRRILIPLARLWDCLPPSAQTAWTIEAPNSADTPSARRPASLPDPEVVYSIALVRPATNNLEIVAEYRFDTTTLTGYKPIELPGAFRGTVLRLNPTEPAHPASDGSTLETSLRPVTDREAPFTEGPVSSARLFKGLEFVESWPSRFPRSCEVVSRDADLNELRDLLLKVDATFAEAIRGLLSQGGSVRRAAASIGLEQLAEIHDRVEVHPVFGGPATAREVLWIGPMEKEQREAMLEWIPTSPFSTTLTSLLAAMENHTVVSGPISPNVITPVIVAATGLTRLVLTLIPGGNVQLSWLNSLTQTTTAIELQKLAGLIPVPGTTSHDEIAQFVADVGELSSHATRIPIAEEFWKPRPTQATLPTALVDKLLIGNGTIAVRSPMTRAEGTALLTAVTSGADREAIRDLYRRSMSAGFADAELYLMVRRGSAVPTKTLIDIKL